MRQGQQNRRGRGRGRKVQSPLARNFESNGPDVKIRGTAAHVAEKYTTLARDAAASGDSVTAENYLQHAEHYNRIIMAAQAQSQTNMAQPSDGANGMGGQRHRRHGTDESAGRAGQGAVAFGDDMDDGSEPHSDDVESSGGRGQNDRDRYGANVAADDSDSDPAAPSEDTPDSVIA